MLLRGISVECANSLGAAMPTFNTKLKKCFEVVVEPEPVVDLKTITFTAKVSMNVEKDQVAKVASVMREAYAAQWNFDPSQVRVVFVDANGNPINFDSRRRLQNSGGSQEVFVKVIVLGVTKEQSATVTQAVKDKTVDAAVSTALQAAELPVSVASNSDSLVVEIARESDVVDPETVKGCSESSIIVFFDECKSAAANKQCTDSCKKGFTQMSQACVTSLTGSIYSDMVKAIEAKCGVAAGSQPAAPPGECTAAEFNPLAADCGRPLDNVKCSQGVYSALDPLCSCSPKCFSSIEALSAPCVLSIRSAFPLSFEATLKKCTKCITLANGNQNCTKPQLKQREDNVIDTAIKACKPQIDLSQPDVAYNNFIGFCDDAFQKSISIALQLGDAANAIQGSGSRRLSAGRRLQNTGAIADAAEDVAAWNEDLVTQNVTMNDPSCPAGGKCDRFMRSVTEECIVAMEKAGTAFFRPEVNDFFTNILVATGKMCGVTFEGFSDVDGVPSTSVSLLSVVAVLLFQILRLR
jgi:hypothetical protein